MLKLALFVAIGLAIVGSVYSQALGLTSARPRARARG